MLHSLQVIKGYLAGIVAFIACPCHLPISLPLLIGLTGGTAFSAWLARNSFLVAAISTVLFIGGTALAITWLSQPNCPPATVVDQTPGGDLAAKPRK
jgi:hypothetical protein